MRSRLSAFDFLARLAISHPRRVVTLAAVLTGRHQGVVLEERTVDPVVAVANRFLHRMIRKLTTYIDDVQWTGGVSC